MRKLFFILLSLACGVISPLASYPCSDVPKVEPMQEVNVLTGRYRLLDLGEVQNDLSELSTHALPVSYAPYINNNGQITYNSGESGFIRDFKIGEAAPQKSRMHGNCLAESQDGSVLVRYNRDDESVEWAICDYEMLRTEKQIPINPINFNPANLYLRALNSHGTAVGCLRPSGPYRPLMRTAKEGLHHFGYWLGWDIEGVLWDVNERGVVVGTIFKEPTAPPFSWSARKGFFQMKNYEKSFERQSHTSLKGASWHFENIVLSPDDTVYGTMTVNFPGGVYLDRNEPYDETFGFMWYPESGEFRLIDFANLKLSRVSKVKDMTVFSGRLNGKAALKQRTLEPVLLQDVVDESGKDWDLLDITSINAKGQLVGYGLKNKILHAFFAEKTYEGLEETPILESKPVFTIPAPVSATDATSTQQNQVPANPAIPITTPEAKTPAKQEASS